MALTAGTRVGSYQITAPIGVGGMGEVWCATDTNLGRQVAIKVLPDTFAHDAERLARLEREAKTLASLNHPNIAIIHGLERGDGVLALVMEFVQSPTLADRIAQGPIVFDEALPIAQQIARALEAAHDSRRRRIVRWPRRVCFKRKPRIRSAATPRLTPAARRERGPGSTALDRAQTAA